MKLNHVLVKADDIDAMQRFFIDVIGLENGYRPPFPFKGAWLYSENQPLIHLSGTGKGDSANDWIKSANDTTGSSGDALIDHIAFDGADFDGLMSRLLKNGNQYSSTTVPDSGRRQVFVSGPEGIRIEMQFPPAGTTLYSPKQLGKPTTKNRIVMAPMTRSRSEQPGDIPTDLMAEYYAQRASAGFIITEATQISTQGKGYSFTPGIYSPEQVAGWRKVTAAVHQAGGLIFSQLWHVGRMSHESLHEDGLPVAPSAIAPDAQVWIVGDDGVGRMLDCPTPRALRTDEIPGIIESFRQAAANAVSAGFDGVEIHGANGYLIDQFLRSTSNHRDDQYGGSMENRVRLAVEIVQAVSDEIGADKVGIRLAPFITQRGMNDPQSVDAILMAARHFNDIGIAYIHLAEADWDDAPVVSEQFRHDLRATFAGAIVVAGNYSVESGSKLLAENLVDYIAFGRKFLANPDLPYRFEHKLPLTEITEPKTLFGGTAHGYTDYPFYQS